MTPHNRWLPDYHPGSLEQLASWQARRDRQDRMIYWGLWIAVALIVGYGAVAGILAMIWR